VDRPIARGAGTVIWESQREQSEAVATGWPSGSVVWSGVWIPALSEEDARRKGEVVFLGRLAEKKGVDLLIEAFALVLESNPGAYLRIIGPGEKGKASALASRAAELGIAEHVAFEGVLRGAEKDDALRRASIHVLPSADESFGASAIEAMAYSTPVVLTRAFPFHEELETAGGCVVADRTPEAVAEAISLLLADRSQANEIGARGRAFVASRFAWDVIACQLVRMYRDLSGRTHTSVAPSAPGATSAGGEAR
jgi:glycosyltransferase involved in cell wall biosynthesis